MERLNEITKSRGWKFIIVYLLCLHMSTNNWMGDVYCTIIAVFYPIFAIWDIIGTKNTKEEVLWITYFSIYALSLVWERYFEFIVNIQYYWFCKALVLILLMSPWTQGASILYAIVEPIFRQKNSNIDDEIKRVLDFGS